jgi:hypothetical protein
MTYRTKASYHAKTPEGKAAQLSGLRQFQKSDVRQYVQKVTLSDLEGMNIIEFAADVLGLSFEKRPAQEVVLRVLYGLPLDDAQKQLYEKLTGNTEVFEDGIEKREGLWVVGRRGGKSTLASIVGLFEACCRGHIWRKHVRAGELVYVVIVATRQKQAEDIIQANCANLLRNSKIAYLVKEDFQTNLRLMNDVAISSFPCNSTAARGYPIACLITDEIAHYQVEGPKADENIFNALHAGQAQFPSSKWLMISTPSAKQGIFYERFNEGFQVPSRVTIQADTRTLNPEIPQDFIDRQYKADEDNARREYGAEFAEQVFGFFSSCPQKLIESFGLTEDVVYQAGQRYCAAIDQSGLSGQDRFTFSIAHRELRSGDKVWQDVLRSWDTRESDVALEEIKGLCATYHVGTVYGDQYAAGWVSDALSKKGLAFEVSERLPVVYTNFKTLVLMGRILLQDRPDLKKGLTETQGFYGRSNKLSIGHERTSEGHGDTADATVRSAFYASQDYTPSTLVMPSSAFKSPYHREGDHILLRGLERRRNFNLWT